jgi:adenosine kinase
MDILLTGSIAYDYLMRFPGRFKDSLVEQSLDKVSLSFLVEDMQRHDGGIGANIAYNMGLLGVRPRLFSTVGRDFGDYRRRLEAVGVDCEPVQVIEEVFTASFFSNTDLDNNQIASFYSGAMQYSKDFAIMDVTVSKPDLVVISPTDPRAMSNYVDECRQHHIPYLFDPSQQVARATPEFLRRGIEHCRILACNEYEWEIIQKHTGYTIDGIQKEGHVFVHTLGSDGANIYYEGEVVHVPTFPIAEIANPTGAGDAFRGGLLSGLAYGFSWKLAGQIGALCAAYTLENVGTQEHQFTRRDFVTRFRSRFDDEGALDSLLD